MARSREHDADPRKGVEALHSKILPCIPCSTRPSRPRARRAPSSPAPPTTSTGSRSAASGRTISSPRSTTPPRTRSSRCCKEAYPDARLPRRGKRQGPREGRVRLGASIRSTAPPTSCTASRSTACRSRCCTRACPTQAVVFDPNRNELFTATKGVGAYLNDRRIRVSKLDTLEGRAHRHRLPVPRDRPPRRLPAHVQERHDGEPARHPPRRAPRRSTSRGSPCGRMDGVLGDRPLALGHGGRRAARARGRRPASATSRARTNSSTAAASSPPTRRSSRAAEGAGGTRGSMQRPPDRGAAIPGSWSSAAAPAAWSSSTQLGDTLGRAGRAARDARRPQPHAPVEAAAARGRRGQHGHPPAPARLPRAGALASLHLRAGRARGPRPRAPRDHRGAACSTTRARRSFPSAAFAYDTLVIAIGSESNDFGTPGRARARLHHRQRVAGAPLPPHARERVLPRQLRGRRSDASHIAIVGAGATGVELAAELHNTIRVLAAYGLENFDPGEADPHHHRRGRAAHPARACPSTSPKGTLRDPRGARRRGAHRREGGRDHRGAR